MKKVQGLEIYTCCEIVNLIRNFINETIEDNGYSADDISIIDIKLNGSRLRGQARADSDLDAVVEYSSNINEDDLSNMLHEGPFIYR